MMLSIFVAGCNARVTEAERRVADTTLNPDAVQFRHTRLSADTLCGEVNAQNASGGYVGFRPFIAVVLDNSPVYPEYPPDDRIGSEKDLRSYLAIDDQACAAAKGYWKQAGMTISRVPQCSMAEEDVARFKAYTAFMARYRECAG